MEGFLKRNLEPKQKRTEMKKIFKTAVLLFATSAMFNSAQAQDPHFSQYYVYPSWMNPALTGVFDGDYRVSAIHRRQWGNVSSPYTTIGASADINTGKNASFGLNVLNQKAGDGGYSYTTAYAGMGYHGVRFGAEGYQRIALGFQLGFIQRGFDPSKMSFGEGEETFARTSVRSFDANVGAMYYDAQPGKKANLFAGASLSHLTKPKQERFIETGNTEQEKLAMRFTAHAGVRVMVNDQFSITPNLLYMRQGTAEEKMIGAYAQLKAAVDADLLIGANYRFKDAVSPYVGVGYKSFVLGLSYDVNTSDLSKIARASNSFELSLTFTGSRKVRTPEAEFVCPRL